MVDCNQRIFFLVLCSANQHGGESQIEEFVIINADLRVDDPAISGIAIGFGALEMFGTRSKNSYDFEVVYFATTEGLQVEIDKLNERGHTSPSNAPGKIRKLLGMDLDFC